MNKKTGLLYKIALCLLIMTAVVAIGFSFAAYTSFNTAKRVVSTTKTEDARFSSNYLILSDINDTVYQNRKITTADSDGTSVFTVEIFNYIYGNPELYNNKSITYDFKVNLVILDLEDVEIQNIKINDVAMESNSYSSTYTLEGGRAVTHSYKFFFPESYKSKIRFEIQAIPKTDSQSAAGGKKLSGNITISTLAISNGWTGKFIDDKTERTVADYDGFNYELSGKGSGVISITIDKKLCLSQWFITDNCISNPTVNKDGSKTYLLYAGEDVEAFQFQIYRNPKCPIDSDEKWSGLTNMVKVYYPVDDSSVQGCPKNS